jgi:hypothetical protein
VKNGLRNSRFNHLGGIKNTFNGPGATKSRIGWIWFVSKWGEQQESEVPATFWYRVLSFFN